MIETVNFGTSVATKAARLVASRLLSATTASGLAPLATFAAARFLLRRQTLGGTSLVPRRRLNSGKPKRASTLAVPAAGVVAEATEGGLDSSTNPEAPVVNGTSLYSGLRQYHSVSDIGLGLDSLKNTIMKPSDLGSVPFGKAVASNAWEATGPVRYSSPSSELAKENKPIANNTWEMGNPIRFAPPVAAGSSKAAPATASASVPPLSSRNNSSTPPALVPYKPDGNDSNINDSIPTPLYELLDKPKAGFWSHTLYGARYTKTQPPVKVLTTASQMDLWASKFLPGYYDSKKRNPLNILSLDLEWTLMAGTDARKTISVVQLAKEDLICIFHLASLPQGFTIPQRLKEVLEDERLIKCGVCIQGDAGRLQRFLGVNVKGVLELSHLHQIIKHSEELAAELAEAARAEAEAAAAVEKEETPESLAEEAAEAEFEAEATAADITEKEEEEEREAAEENEASTSEVDTKKASKKAPKKPTKISKKIVSLAKLAEEYFGLPLDKGPVRCEPWHLKLRDDQVRYAAADAYAGVKLYEEMQRRRHAFDVRPEMPEVIHYLDDGTKACTKWGNLLPTEAERKAAEPTDTPSTSTSRADKTKTTATATTSTTRTATTNKAISISSDSESDEDPYSPLESPTEPKDMQALLQTAPQTTPEPSSTTPKDLFKMSKIISNWTEAYVRRLEKSPPTGPTLKDHKDYKLWLTAYGLFQRNKCTSQEIAEVVWPSKSSASGLEVNQRPLGPRPINAEETVLGWISSVSIVEGLPVDRDRIQEELVALSRR
ncbi:hypothetical protein BJ508DRAFT_414895 [Ascobolus immersus RN42]|uniref:3'-5' exonuclease domain-containing protein n=1 Tax=Ascobolus immersus RN42 TaxID=1160509 RepID=A0A3N4IAS4_ASCIM|nr:hypothetical protein BJ508DRAFT_414895 [Ascobolus immersus RN42]